MGFSHHFIDAIEKLSSEEVRKIPQKNGEFIPTLKEVLEACKDKIVVNIELKGEKLLVVDKVFDVVNELQMWNQITLSSFYHPYHDHAKVVLDNMKLDHRIYFGFLAHKIEEIPTYTERNYKESDSLNLDVKLLTNHREVMVEHVNRARENKQKIKIYFPMVIAENDEIYEEMLSWNIDTIITNHPLKLIEYLKKKENENEKAADSPLLSRENFQELRTEAAKYIDDATQDTDKNEVKQILQD